MIGIGLAGIETTQSDGLITDYSGGAIGGSGINAVKVQVGLGANDEEAAGPMQDVQTFPIQITAIDHVESTEFR